MIAVVKIGGHQAIVSKGDVIRIDRIEAKEGSKISLDTFLTSEPDGKEFSLGAPLLSTKVEAKVIEHARDEKVRVLKMKRRKRYRRELGHRQDYTVIEITSLGGAKAAPKAATEKKAAAPAKKAPAKKPVAKKTESK
ncbi:UNVERIFIED_CONTAM: hypothetical protein GTU68_026643 [Idotea baltica]|nr:hypothetical protein [Idotea baltica]